MKSFHIGETEAAIKPIEGKFNNEQRGQHLRESYVYY